jgi:hypothetical protein
VAQMVVVHTRTGEVFEGTDCKSAAAALSKWIMRNFNYRLVRPTPSSSGIDDLLTGMGGMSLHSN